MAESGRETTPGPTTRAPRRLITEVRHLAVTLSVAALLIVVIAAFRLVYSANVTTPTEERLRDGLLAVDDAAQSMLAADTAWRSYLATGDPWFVDRADQAATALAEADTRLAGAFTAPHEQDLVLALRLAEQRWLTGWVDRARGLPPGSPAPPALLEPFLREGSVLLDAYRSDSADLQMTALTASRSNQAMVTAVSRTAGGLVVVIGLVTLGLASRGRRRLERKVVGPVDRLLASVRDVTAGRLDPPGPVEGTAEMTALRDGLAEMTTVLRERRDEAAERTEHLRSQGDRLRTVLAMAREIAGSLNTRYVVESTVQAATSITGGRVLLWLLDEDEAVLALAYDSKRGAVPPGEEQCRLGVGVVGRTARYGRITRGDPEAGDSPGVAVPLVVGARVTGVVECVDGEDGGADEDGLPTVEMLATLAGSAIEASRLHAATERLSQFDPLTQLANRRRLGVDLDGAVANAKRHGFPMSVIMMDLDHFKALNDRYGHQQGDVVLQEVAAVLRSTVRTGEAAYRYGGEEFAIVVTHGDTEAAAVLAERIRSRVESEFLRGGRQLVTASLGIATLPDHAEDGETLVGEADRALYSAKHAGRNRAHRAGSGPIL